MDLTPRGLVAHARSPLGTKLFRYSMVSVICVAVSQIVIFVALHFLSAVPANILAVAVGTIPSYELNRKWAWGKSGKSHLWREVVPFWTMSFIGLVFSTLSVDVATHFVGDHPATLGGKLVINAANLGAFGVLWIAKFVIINKLLFAHQREEIEPTLEPTLDGRAGVPT